MSKLKRSPFYLVPRMSWIGFNNHMTHLAAMLDGAKSKRYKFEQRGAMNYVLPADEIELLQAEINDNEKAKNAFATWLSPAAFLLEVGRIGLDTTKRVLDATILYALAPVIALLGFGTFFIPKKTAAYRLLDQEEAQWKKVETVVSKSKIQEPEKPFKHLISVDEKGYRGSDLLTKSYVDRIDDANTLIDRIFELPIQIAKIPLNLLDNNKYIRIASWILFPVRLALKILEIGVEAGSKLLSATFKLGAVPVVSLVHAFSLIPYKKFRAALKNLTVTVKKEGREVSESLEDYVTETYGENASFKSILNSLDASVSFYDQHNGTAKINARLPNQNERVSFLVTHENKATFLAAIHRNTFGWAKDSHFRDQLEDFCKQEPESTGGGSRSMRMGRSDMDVIEL